MDRIERIKEMEECLDTAQNAIDRLEAAFDEYMKAKPSIEKLTAYYESQLWRSDFEYDESGKLPPELKRGVLSEDAVFNMLADDRDLRERISKELNAKE